MTPKKANISGHLIINQNLILIWKESLRQQKVEIRIVIQNMN